MKNYFIKMALILISFVIIIVTCCSLVFTEDRHFQKDTPYKLSSYLSEKGITINENLIKTDTRYIFNADLQSITTDKAALSKNLLGESSAGLAETYTSSTGTVAFTGSDFNFKPTNIYASEFIKDANKYDAGKKVQKMLNAMNFKLDGSTLAVIEHDKGYSVTVIKTIEKLPVFNDYMTVELNSSGVTSISGRWYYTTSSTKDKRAAKSIADALIGLLHTKRNEDKFEITNIELGYMLTDTSTDKATLRPAWRFEKANGESVYIDA